MNLYYNPSMNELLELIRRTENHNNLHNLVVDYDGEVLIDPQILQPELEVSKFKVLLKLSDPSMKMIGDKKSCLRNLLNIILKAWYNGEAGIHTSIGAHSSRTQATGKNSKKTLHIIH
jgi:hypothetical protein